MIYTQKLQEAINFAIKVHQLDQNQTRKGKSVPYITHPMSVGLILSIAGAKEDVVIAGILHDTIEDCKPYGSITKEIIAKEFGEEVSEMVNDVTEQDKSVTWPVRKQQALEHIAHMGKGSLLVKSADVLHNFREQLADYKVEGDEMFKRFNAPKSTQLQRYEKLVVALKIGWENNPLLAELEVALKDAKKLWA